MPRKKRLDVVFDYDFELFGITSAARPFKLAWALNQALGLHLTRQDDLAVELPQAHFFAHFRHQRQASVFRLFRNKPAGNEAHALLVPEYPHIDYIFYQQGADLFPNNRLQQLLRNIPSVELACFLPLAAIKKKDLFIF
jgi:hypothetical protein